MGRVLIPVWAEKATEKEKAHSGTPATLKMAPGPKDYYPDPGSIWIAENSCGACHVGYVYRTQLSLMNTEAGKIQGNLHTWGFEEVANFKVPWGNYDVEDVDGLGVGPGVLRECCPGQERQGDAERR